MTRLELKAYFIAKFSAIPEEEWTTGSYNRDGKSCALGHLGGPLEKTEMCALIELLGDERGTRGAISRASRINDGEDSRYQQPTPKARTLAALEDVK